MALNEDANRRLDIKLASGTCDDREAQRASDASANVGTVDCDEGHGVVATFA